MTALLDPGNAFSAQLRCCGHRPVRMSNERKVCPPHFCGRHSSTYTLNNALVARSTQVAAQKGQARSKRGWWGSKRHNRCWLVREAKAGARGPGDTTGGSWGRCRVGPDMPLCIWAWGLVMQGYRVQQSNLCPQATGSQMFICQAGGAMQRVPLLCSRPTHNGTAQPCGDQMCWHETHLSS